MRIIAADTDLTPIDIGSYSSRVTFMAGNATMRAAEDVKKRIAAAAANEMNCGAEDLVFRDDLVFKRGSVPPAVKKDDAEEVEVTQAGASVSGRIEGQILRGSLQQKRKEEGPKEWMTFAGSSGRRD